MHKRQENLHGPIMILCIYIQALSLSYLSTVCKWVANIHKDLNTKDPCHSPPCPPSLPPPSPTLQIYRAVCLMGYCCVMLQKRACWEVHQHSVLS